MRKLRPQRPQRRAENKNHEKHKNGREGLAEETVRGIEKERRNQMRQHSLCLRCESPGSCDGQLPHSSGPLCKCQRLSGLFPGHYLNSEQHGWIGLSHRSPSLSCFIFLCSTYRHLTYCMFYLCVLFSSTGGEILSVSFTTVHQSLKKCLAHSMCSTNAS